MLWGRKQEEQLTGRSGHSPPYPHVLSCDPSGAPSPQPSPDPQQLPPFLPSQRGWGDCHLASHLAEKSTVLYSVMRGPANRTQNSINNLPGWQVSREIAWLVAETKRGNSVDPIRCPTTNLPHPVSHLQPRLGVDRMHPRL